MSTPRIPIYRLHRASGQAVVTLDGRDHYLGRHGSPESRMRYDSLVAEWIRGGRKLEDDGRPLIVEKLAEKYLAWAETYYRKNGKPTTQVHKVKVATGDLARLAGKERAAAFGPAKLIELRASWERRYSRETVNSYVGIVRRMFRWASERELLPPTAYHGLLSVRGLARGRSGAREGREVLPVPREHVEAVAAFMGEPWATLIRVQEAAGMRPGEACSMRACDVDRSGPIWRYTPGSHKSEHLGKSRAIFLGPTAQCLLAPLLDVPGKPDRHLFSFVRGPRAGKVVTVQGYSERVGRACKRAGVPHWHPNRLRHNAATEIRRRYGLEASRVVLGHSQVETTQVYAERDERLAERVMGEIG